MGSECGRPSGHQTPRDLTLSVAFAEQDIRATAQASRTTQGVTHGTESQHRPGKHQAKSPSPVALMHVTCGAGSCLLLCPATCASTAIMWAPENHGQPVPLPGITVREGKRKG